MFCKRSSPEKLRKFCVGESFLIINNEQCSVLGGVSASRAGASSGDGDLQFPVRSEKTEISIIPQCTEHQHPHWQIHYHGNALVCQDQGLQLCVRRYETAVRAGRQHSETFQINLTALLG